MKVVIPTKNIPNVKDKFIEKNVEWTVDKGNEDYIKKELGIDDR